MASTSSNNPNISRPGGWLARLKGLVQNMQPNDDQRDAGLTEGTEEVLPTWDVTPPPAPAAPGEENVPVAQPVPAGEVSPDVPLAEPVETEKPEEAAAAEEPAVTPIEEPTGEMPAPAIEAPVSSILCP